MTKTKNIFQKLVEVNHQLNCTKLNKSGKNNFGGFAYYELEDLLPTIEKACYEQGLLMNFKFDNMKASIIFINAENPKEQYKNEFPINIKELPNLPKMNDFQVFGAMMTYYKRYLLLNTFNISEDSIIDNENYDAMTKEAKKSTKKEAPKKQANKEKTEEDGTTKIIKSYCKKVTENGKKVNKKTLTDIIIADFRAGNIERDVKNCLIDYIKFMKMSEVKQLQEEFDVKKDG